MLNRYFIGRRWPTEKQGLLLAVSIGGILTSGEMFKGLMDKESNQAVWAQVIGALCILWLSTKPALAIISELTAKNPVEAEPERKGEA